jgi:hypothetical protein
VTHVVAASDLQLSEAAAFDRERVYALGPGEAAQAVAAATPAATYWTARGALVDLGELRTVARVVFEVSEARWVDRPTVHVSTDGAAFEEVQGTASLADAAVSLYRDPRHGRGEVRFERRQARFLRLGPRVPARRGALEVGE